MTDKGLSMIQTGTTWLEQLYRVVPGPMRDVLLDFPIQVQSEKDFTSLYGQPLLFPHWESVKI